VGLKEAEQIIQSLRRLSIIISNLVDYLKHSDMKAEKFKNGSSRLRGARKEKVPSVEAIVNGLNDLNCLNRLNVS
jgi:hypothetical protein